jgi:hypothetical protein
VVQGGAKSSTSTIVKGGVQCVPSLERTLLLLFFANASRRSIHNLPSWSASEFEYLRPSREPNLIYIYIYIYTEKRASQPSETIQAS